MQIQGINVTVQGKFLKTAALEMEFYENLTDPDEAAQTLKKSGNKVDLLTFLEKFPEVKPRPGYFLEWDNFAVIKLEDYENWFKNDLPKQTRKGIKKSRRRGVEVRIVDFDHELLMGIKENFDDQPVRQGKPFWHYNKSLEEVREEMGKDLDQSLFFGAYYNGELIGFIKMLIGDNWARTVTVVSKIAHKDKYPINVLFSSCVEYCLANGITYLVYGRYEYGNVGSQTLTDFKKHNGFKKMMVPRYYIPLTLKGRIAILLRLHHGIAELLPRRVIQTGLKIRRKYYYSR